MNCKYSRLATAIMLSVGVSACGGGGGGSDSSPAPKTDVNVKLIVQDEYGAPVPNITVCLDSNGDELCTVSIDEQLKSTDSSGVAVQSLTKDQIKSGTNLLAVVNNKKSFTNVTSENLLTSVKDGSSGSSVSVFVNPLTQQLYRYSRNQSLDIETAKSVLAGHLGTNASVFDSSIKADSAVSAFVVSLSNMNHSLNSSSVIDNVRNAVADIQAAMNKGVSVDGVAGSYAKYGDFKHLLENVDDNHSPIITNARAQEVSCRTVMFTASATDEDNDTLSYKWEFDDGAVEKQKNVEHVFNSIGDHSAKVSVSDNVTTVSETVHFKTTSAMCGEELKANFSITEVNYLKVSFANTSTGGAVSYLWNFGDNVTSTEQNPTHTYAEAGEYSVSLIITDSDGNQSEPYVQTVKVSAEPVVLPNYSFSVQGLTVTFETDGKNPVWDITDGEVNQKIEGSSISWTYSRSGTYPVILYCNDGKNTTTQSFDVKVEAPVLVTVSIAEQETNGLTVSMKASSSGVSGKYSYSWNMGDGKTETGSEIVHTYDNEGKYAVVLSLLDENGKVLATDTKDVDIGGFNHAPESKFDYVVADDGVTVTFRNESSDRDGDRLTYEWDFGDGISDTSENPVHTYPSETKQYEVVLVVSDGKDTGKSTRIVPVTVSPNNPPVAVISSSISGLTLTYKSESTDPDGDAITSYAWDFGDGTKSNTASGTHTYAEAGEYTVTLVVSDGKENSTAATKLVKAVVNHAPVAKITSGLQGKTLTYSSEGSTDEDGDTLTFAWDFGDGTSSDKAGGTHTYSKDGSYTVKLVVSDGKEQSIPATKTVVVGDSGDFEVDFTYSFNGLTGSLSAFSTLKTSVQASYAWDFGDGMTSNSKNPTVTYKTGGEKTITLTVTSDGKSVQKSYTFELVQGTSVAPEKRGIYYKGDADGIYIWNDNSTALVGEWPGTSMTVASEDPNWSFFDTSAINETTINVIFLKGGDKLTGDLLGAPVAGCYDGKWTVIDSCVLSGASSVVSGGGEVYPPVEPDPDVLSNNIPWNVTSGAALRSTADGISNVEAAPYVVPSLNPGSYHTDQTLTLGAEDADGNSTEATIYYTLDNTEPTTASTKYTGAIDLKDTSEDKLGTAYRLRALVVGANGMKQEQHFFWFIKSKDPTPAPATDFRDETIYFVVTARYYDGDESNNYYCRDRFDIDDPCWRGDFKGLIEKLDYIKSMGFTAIWITPPVENRSGLDYHGYHAYDWFQPDLRLESPGATYFDFIKAAHAKGIKVVQDVVLNHSSNYGIRGQTYIDKIPTKYFVDAKYGKDGVNIGGVYTKNIGDYKSYNRCDNDNPVAPAWHRRVCAGDADAQTKFTVHFTKHGKTVDMAVDGTSFSQNDGTKNGYYWSPATDQELPSKWYHEAYTNNWESVEEVQQRSMAGDCVDLTTESDNVKNYMNAMMRLYLDMGIDAVRIDTLKHMPREDVVAMTSKWQKYKPGLFIYGEALIKGFGDNTPYKLLPWYYTRTSTSESDKSGDSGVSVLDFSLMSTFRDNVTKGSVGGLADVFNRFDSWYADPTKLVTFFQNHDLTPDNTWSGSGAQHCCSDRHNSALAYNVLWTVRGIPVMYAGDETGARVGLPPDLTSSNDLVKDTGRLYLGDTLDNGDAIIPHITDLNAMRKASIALRRGTLKVLNGEPLVFERIYGNDVAIVAIPGTGGANVTVSGATDGVYQDLVTGVSYTVSGGSVNLGNIPGASMRVLVKGYTGGKVVKNSQFLK